MLLIDFTMTQHNTTQSLVYCGGCRELRRKDGIIELLQLQLSMCGVQVPKEEMPTRLHLRTLLPTGRASEVRERAQDLRR